MAETTINTGTYKLFASQRASGGVHARVGELRASGDLLARSLRDETLVAVVMPGSTRHP
jgi:hypothetical protein